MSLLICPYLESGSLRFMRPPAGRPRLTCRELYQARLDGVATSARPCACNRMYARSEWTTPSSIASSRASGSRRQKARRSFCSISGSMAVQFVFHVAVLLLFFKGEPGRPPKTQPPPDLAVVVGGGPNPPH